MKLVSLPREFEGFLPTQARYPLLSGALAAFAAVMVVGARATGKTTTTARLAVQVPDDVVALFAARKSR